VTLKVRLINPHYMRGAVEVLNDLQPFMRIAKHQVAVKAAQHFLVELKANIYGQTMNLAPLSPRYLEEKKRLGRDPRILLATHELARRLQVFEVKDDVYIAGLRGGERVPGTSLTFAEVMAILEHGAPSRNLPARPLFKLTLLDQEVQLQRVAAKEFGRIFRMHVKERMR
jgi:hypothetical protein